MTSSLTIIVYRWEILVRMLLACCNEISGILSEVPGGLYDLPDLRRWSDDCAGDLFVLDVRITFQPSSTMPLSLKPSTICHERFSMRNLFPFSYPRLSVKQHKGLRLLVYVPIHVCSAPRVKDKQRRPRSPSEDAERSGTRVARVHDAEYVQSFRAPEYQAIE